MLKASIKLAFQKILTTCKNAADHSWISLKNSTKHCNFKVIDFIYPFHFNGAIRDTKIMANVAQNADLKKETRLSF